MCTKYNIVEGYKFGNKCHFAHGEWELGKPIAPSYEDPRAIGLVSGRFGAHSQPPAPIIAKISVDASLAGVKLAIRDHESDPNLKNIELTGTFEQIKEASTMVGADREHRFNMKSRYNPWNVKMGWASTLSNLQLQDQV
ncbi:hypothetical protein LguiA_011688 [Lonicera macranthoides]